MCVFAPWKLVPFFSSQQAPSGFLRWCDLRVLLGQAMARKPNSSKSVAIVRHKTRMTTHGKRIWVSPGRQQEISAHLDGVHAKAKKWSIKSWSERVNKELQTRFGYLGHGGRRKGRGKGKSARCQLVATEQIASKACGGETVHDLVSLPPCLPLAEPPKAKHLTTKSVGCLGLPPVSEMRFGRRLGSGSYGEVFEYRHKNKEFAVKILHEKVPHDVTQIREIQILTHLGKGSGHKGILKLLAWRRSSELRILMFFRSFASDLRALVSASFMDPQKRMSRRQMVYFAARSCDAIAFMHKSRVLHRDIKPSNILLEVSREGDEFDDLFGPVFADFSNAAILQPAVRSNVGLASASMSRLSAAGLHRKLTGNVTTPGYACPEMLIPREYYSYPCDIWALGMVLVEVECLQHACPTGNGDALWQQLLQIWLFSMAQPHLRKALFATSASGEQREQSEFISRARQNLVRHVSPERLVRSLSAHKIGSFYGHLFARFVSKLLTFAPSARSTAQELGSLFSECSVRGWSFWSTSL